MQSPNNVKGHCISLEKLNSPGSSLVDLEVCWHEVWEDFQGRNVRGVKVIVSAVPGTSHVLSTCRHVFVERRREEIRPRT